MGLFALVTECIPASGQAYALSAALHKVAAELGLVTACVLILPAWLLARHLDRRCRELAIPAIHGGPAAWPQPLLVLCLTARPYLVWRERHWLAQDRILAVGPDEVGISRLENQATARLKNAVSAVLAGMGEGAR